MFLHPLAEPLQYFSHNGPGKWTHARPLPQFTGAATKQSDRNTHFLSACITLTQFLPAGWSSFL